MKKFILLFVLLLITTECDDEYSSMLPYSIVSLTCDLGRAENALLIEAGNNKSFIKQTTSRDYLGYGGILLVNSWTPYDSSQPFAAYDLSCPIEASRTTRVVPTQDGWYAICPVCNSKFDIGSGGYGGAVSGPALTAKKHLETYKVYRDGNILYVKNR